MYLIYCRHGRLEKEKFSNLLLGKEAADTFECAGDIFALALVDVEQKCFYNLKPDYISKEKMLENVKKIFPDIESEKELPEFLCR